MTAYQSRNSVPVIPGPEAYRLSDAYVNATQDIPRPEELPVDTLAGGLSWTGVMKALDKGAEMPGEPRSRIPRVPVWSLVCIVAGSVLMALGCLLNAQVAAIVWELTR